MNDDKKDHASILFHIASQQGAMDSNVQNLREDFKEFKEQYVKNAQSARDHAKMVELELSFKMDRRDHPALVLLSNVVKSWPGIAFLIILACSVGILTIGPAFEKVSHVWRQITGKAPVEVRSGKTNNK